MNRRACASAGVPARFVGGHRSCCSCPGGRRGLDRLELADPRDRTDGLNPPRVQSGVDPLDFVEGVVAVDLNPQVLRERIEGHAEAVAEAVGEHLAQVRGDFAAHPLGGAPERIVPRRRSVVVQPQHDAASDARRRGPGRRTGRRRRGRGRPLREVLQPAAASDVAHDDIELVVGTEANHAAVVVAARVLRGVVLVAVAPGRPRPGTSAARSGCDRRAASCRSRRIDRPDCRAAAPAGSRWCLRRAARPHRTSPGRGGTDPTGGAAVRQVQ